VQMGAGGQVLGNIATAGRWTGTDKVARNAADYALLQRADTRRHSKRVCSSGSRQCVSSYVCRHAEFRTGVLTNAADIQI
jgi:hypothetical protein